MFRKPNPQRDEAIKLRVDGAIPECSRPDRKVTGLSRPDPHTHQAPTSQPGPFGPPLDRGAALIVGRPSCATYFHGIGWLPMASKLPTRIRWVLLTPQLRLLLAGIEALVMGA